MLTYPLRPWWRLPRRWTSRVVIGAVCALLVACGSGFPAEQRRGGYRHVRPDRGACVDALRRAVRDRVPLDGQHMTAARHRSEQRAIVVFEQTPDRVDPLRERVLGHHAAGLHAGHRLVLRDDVAGLFREDEQGRQILASFRRG